MRPKRNLTPEERKLIASRLLARQFRVGKLAQPQATDRRSAMPIARAATRRCEAHGTQRRSSLKLAWPVRGAEAHVLTRRNRRRCENAMPSTEATHSHSPRVAESGRGDRYRVPRRMRDGQATGVYEDFMAGFELDKNTVWGGWVALQPRRTAPCCSVRTPTLRPFVLRQQFDNRGPAPTTIVGYFQGGGSRLT
jgi:hypothetical protein